jgi:hypothetical protein
MTTSSAEQKWSVPVNRKEGKKTYLGSSSWLHPGHHPSTVDDQQREEPLLMKGAGGKILVIRIG